MLPDDLQLNLVETWEDAESVMNWLRSVTGPAIGCDTETGGLEWYQLPLRTVQFGDLHRGWTIPWMRWGGLVQEIINRWTRDVVFHNAKFDLLFLEDNGVRVPRRQVQDSMLLHRVVDPHLSAALKPATDRLVDPRVSHLAKELDLAMMKGRWDWGTVPIQLPQYWQYAALDPVATLAIWTVLQERLTPGLTRAYEIDLENSFIVMEMEQRGQQVDLEYCAYASRQLRQHEESVQDWALETFGVNDIGSDAKMIRWFNDKGYRWARVTEKGKTAFDKVVLQQLQHPLADGILLYRRSNKRRTTYFDPWLRYERASRIHPSFNISGARTARMSSERPNLQNVPRSRQVRRGLVARPGHVLVLADYDQIELRLMAHFARSKPMIDAIHAGEDLHSYTAKLVYQVAEPSKEQRRVAKHSNFAKIYGAGLNKFALTAEVPVEEAREFLSGYDAQFPEVKAFQTEIGSLARTSAAQDPDGLARIYSELTGRQQVADPREAYKLVNYRIQGEAADVLKLKMIDVHNSGMGEFLTIPIHDELAFEVPEEDAEDFARALPEVMEDHSSYVVPLTVGVEIVPNWGDKYEEGT